MDIMDDLGAKFQTLTDTEKSYVTEALAGKMRANVLKAIMLNYDMVQKQVTESQTAYGAAMVENGKRMEGIEAKTKQLSAAMTEFWQRSINSDLIKQVIDFGISLAEFARKMGGLGSIIRTIAVAFASWKLMPLILSTITLNSRLAGMAIELVAASNGALTYAQALRQVRIEQGATKTSAIGLKTILGGLTIALTLLSIGYGVYANSKAEAEYQTEQFVNKLNDEKTAISADIQEYEKLKKQQLEGKDVRQQLQSLQEKINTTYGIEADKLDLVSGKYKNQIEILTDYLNLKSEEILLTGKTQYETAKDTMGNVTKTEIAPSQKQFYPTDDLEKYEQKLKTVIKTTDVYGATTYSLKGTLEEQSSTLRELISDYGNIEKLTPQQTRLLKILETQYKSIDLQISKNKATIENFETAMSNQNFGKKFKDDILEAKNLILDLSNAEDEASKTDLNEKLNTLQNSMIDVAKNGKNSEEVISKIKSIFAETTSEVENNTEALDENTASTIEKTKADKEEYSTLSDLKTQIEFLSKAEKELTDDRKLSGDSIMEIIKKYPELIKYIGNEEAMLKAVKQAQIDKGKTAQSVLETEMMNSKTYWDYLLSGNADMVNSLASNYGIDLTNFNSVASAKLDADNKIRAAIGEGWASLYSNSGYTPRQQVGAAIGMLTSMSVGSAQEANARRKEIQKLQSIANNYDAITQFASQIKATVKTVGFSGANLTSASGSGASGSKKKDAGSTASNAAPSATVSANEKLIERDRYFQLNQELSKYNQLIQKNQVLQEVSEGQKKIKLLEEEIKLSKQKQNILHKIANENRKERSEIVNSLKKQGIKFTGTGDSLTATNAQSILDKQVAETNKHRTDKNKTIYNREKEELENLQKQLNIFFKIQNEEVPDLSQNWIKLSATINELGITVNDLYKQDIIDAYDSFNKQIDIQNNSINNLSNELNMLDDSEDNQIKKIAIYKKQIEETVELQNMFNKEIAELNILIPRNTEEEELLTQQLSELNNKASETTTTIYQLGQSIKDTTQTIIESQKSQADEMIQTYLDSVTKKVENEITRFEELKNAENDRLQTLIDNLDKEIQLLEEKEDLLKEEETRQDKLLAIEKARKALSETTNEKTIKVYRAGLGFVYESDIKQKEKDIETVKDLESDYAIWERDLATNKKIENLRITQEEYREDQKQNTENYDKQIEQLNLFISEQNKIFENSNKYQINSLEDLYTHLNTLDERSFLNRLTNLGKFIEDYNSKLSEIDDSKLSQLTTNYIKPGGTNIGDMILEETENPINVDQSSIKSTESAIVQDDDLILVNQGLEGKKIYESVSSVEARQKTRYDKALLDNDLLKAAQIKKETESATGRIASFKNEGFTGTGYTEGWTKVHPKEFILKKDTVSNLLSGNLDSIINKVPDFKIKSPNNTTTNNSDIFNIKEIKVVTNDAYDFHKNLKQIIQKK